MTTTTEERSSIPAADKARFHSWSIDAELEEIMKLADEGELSEDEQQILEHTNQSLRNLRSVLTELKTNIQDDGTDSA